LSSSLYNLYEVKKSLAKSGKVVPKSLNKKIAELESRIQELADSFTLY
jgi:hypothetical protein